MIAFAYKRFLSLIIQQSLEMCHGMPAQFNHCSERILRLTTLEPSAELSARMTTCESASHWTVSYSWTMLQLAQLQAWALRQNDRVGAASTGSCPNDTTERPESAGVSLGCMCVLDAGVALQPWFWVSGAGVCRHGA